MYDLPSYVWALVLTGVIGIPAATSVMLYRGAVPARLGRRTATGVAVVAAYVLGWRRTGADTSSQPPMPQPRCRHRTGVLPCPNADVQ